MPMGPSRIPCSKAASVALSGPAAPPRLQARAKPKLPTIGSPADNRSKLSSLRSVVDDDPADMTRGLHDRGRIQAVREIRAVFQFTIITSIGVQVSRLIGRHPDLLACHCPQFLPTLPCAIDRNEPAEGARVGTLSRFDFRIGCIMMYAGVCCRSVSVRETVRINPGCRL